MPTYDYECQACGAEWELFQSIKANPIKKCPECGKQKARRKIGTGAAILFKGGGFYQTDYRSDSYKKGADAAKKSESGEAKPSADSSTKKESKSSPSDSST
ncbi:MAG: zinc ribbon domain-containing protein [Planctomycetaceae bacterium]|nr:zinc ribbon domain-containing protein [Planctomycetaceae bacterium]